MPEIEVPEARMPQQLFAPAPRRVALASFAAGVALTLVAALLLGWKGAGIGLAAPRRVSDGGLGAAGSSHPGKPAREPASGVVTLSRAQQEAIGLTVVPAVLDAVTDVIEATGQVAPDESKFAYITPRAAGIVRTVRARLGQDVQAGSLLAMIDSSEIAKARFDLNTCLQELEIARTQAEWQAKTYKNIHELVEMLRSKPEPDPEQIQLQFRDRPLGENREQLMKAYVDFRHKTGKMDSLRELFKQKAIARKEFLQVQAEYESAVATYEGLMDQMEYTNYLANVRAQQSLQRAETALRVAREQLRVLGVRPDGTEPEIKDGKVVGVLADGSLPTEPGKPADAPNPKPAPIRPDGEDDDDAPVMPVGAPTDADPKAKDLPVSTYAIWAPFDGTVLDREQIVPGVYVDTTHRIFTIADLSSVWIEVAIHESRYGALSRSQDATVILTSEAYPGRRFEAGVIYTGDTVDLKTRTIKLLARAENRDRALKPGMFVKVALHLKGTHQAIVIPDAALTAEGNHSIVFVQIGPERFERRVVDTGVSDGAKVAVLKGLEPGAKVVVAGAFKLKSKTVLVTD
jgi:multidrug efflux pump subunit AcrA (membrane-fusion protein)